MKFSHLANTIDASDEAELLFQWPKKDAKLQIAFLKVNKGKSKSMCLMLTRL